MIHAKVHRNLADPTIIESIEFIVTNTDDTINQFRTILNQALNCRPEAPACWKELSDMLEHGRILQDYHDPKYTPLTRKDAGQ